MTPNCQSCRHFLPISKAEEQVQDDGTKKTVSVSRDGLCRRYPPDPVMVNGNNLQHRFRLIENPATTVCGEYVALEEEA